MTESLFRHRHTTVWIWGRGQRVSRIRLAWAALTQSNLHLHRWGKPS